MTPLELLEQYKGFLSPECSCFNQDHIDFMNFKTNDYKKFFEQNTFFRNKTCINIVNNEITLSNKYDIVFGLEIKATSLERVELVIGGTRVYTYYFINQDENGFWIINFKDFLVEAGCLCTCAIYAHAVKLKIYGENIEKAFVKTGFIIDENQRQKFIEQAESRDFLVNNVYNYDVDMNGDSFIISSLNSPYTLGLSSFNTNTTSEIIMDFGESNIDFDEISLYHNYFFEDERGLITIINKNDIDNIGNGKFVLKNFDYRIFLFDKIKVQFNKSICSKLTLIFKIYNLLMIRQGFTGLKYAPDNNKQIITNITFSSIYSEISSELYLKKVVPKNDKICSISHEEFLEDEKRFICGQCFASFKEEPLKLWFETSNKKICPYSRCIYKWYVKSPTTS